MKSSKFSGIGNLALQPEYVAPLTSQVKIRARFYRPLIGIALTLVLLITLLEYRNEDLTVLITLVAAIAAYWIVFAVRLRISEQSPTRYYRPVVQFLRAVISLGCVTGVIFILAGHGLTDHQVWLLYVMATLLVCEHNRPSLVKVTFVAIALLMFMAEAVGLVYISKLLSWEAFLLNHSPSVLAKITCIGLVTFVFDYLLRNIKGRDAAVSKLRDWLFQSSERELIPEKDGQFFAQFISFIEEITGARVRLWIPRLSDGRLECANSNASENDAERAESAAQSRSAPAIVQKRAPGDPFKVEMVKVLRRLTWWFSSSRSMMPDPVYDPELSVPLQMYIPLYQDGELSRSIGVVDLAYSGYCPDHFNLGRHYNWILEFVGFLRLRVAEDLKKRQADVQTKFDKAIGAANDISGVLDTLVQSVVADLGFDTADVWTVDSSEKRLVWHGRDPQSPFGGDISLDRAKSEYDLRVKAVTELQTLIYDNSSTWPEKHRRWVASTLGASRYVWIPIPPVDEIDPWPHGVLQVSLHATRCACVPSNAVGILEQFVASVTRKLKDMRRFEREQQAINQQRRLITIAEELLEEVVLGDIEEAAQVVGGYAKQLFPTALIMVYTWNENSRDLALPFLYDPRHLLDSDSTLTLDMSGNVLECMYETQSAYFQPHVEKDALFFPQATENGQEGRTSFSGRTFSQVHEVKSFAGAPLVGKGQIVLGFICLNYREPRDFSNQDHNVLEFFVMQAAYALEQATSQQFLNRLLLEKERERVSSEIHSRLSGVLLGLETMIKSAQHYHVKGQMERVERYLNDAAGMSKEVRNVVHELLKTRIRPTYNEVNFGQRLERYCESMRSVSTAEFHLSYEGHDQVPETTQHFLLRIAQEAITNAIKHAGCAKICVNCVAYDEDIVLIVEDDGRGFDTALVTLRDKGHGLWSMRYFARQIQCQLSIESNINQGTRVVVSSRPRTH